MRSLLYWLSFPSNRTQWLEIGNPFLSNNCTDLWFYRVTSLIGVLLLCCRLRHSRVPGLIFSLLTCLFPPKFSYYSVYFRQTGLNLGPVPYLCDIFEHIDNNLQEASVFLLDSSKANHKIANGLLFRLSENGVKWTNVEALGTISNEETTVC